MIHHPCAQGGEQWHSLRVGVPTASNFDKIITSKKWDLAAGRRTYAIRLLTEKILGMPLDGAATPAMLHGNDSEAKAVAAYELEYGIDTEVCGFCTTDDGSVGASPDRFVGTIGLLEVKCPFNPEIHVGYMANPAALVDEYFTQTQGQLHVCSDREWTDLISYFAGLPMVCVRVDRHPEFQSKLQAALGRFVPELAEMVELAKEKGWIKERKSEPVRDFSAEFVSDEDVTAILAAQRGEAK